MSPAGVNLAEAMAQHRAGDRTAAERLYRRTLVGRPNDPEVLHGFGVLCHETGRTSEALTLLGRAVQLDPTVAQYAANLGGVLSKLKHYDQAIACLQHALKHDPRHSDAARNLALTMSLRFELLDQTAARNRQAWTTERIAIRSAQSSQAAILEAALVTAHGANGTVEGACHGDLIDPTLIDQTHHRVGLSQSITHRIVSQHNAADEHYAMAILRSQQTAVIDDARVRRVVSFRE